MSEVKVLKKVKNLKDDKDTDAAELLNSVIFTVDPKLDSVGSKNALSAKAATAKKLFSNYRKAQL